MYRSGLTSISFRKLSCEEIIDLAKGRVDAIEWGGDVHLPPGDTARAKEIAERSQAAGLLTPSYGSYYRAGVDEDFESVLQSALALGAETIRVWAGNTGSETICAEHRAQVTQDLVRITKLAREAHLTVSAEYHRNTLTDCAESALQLIREVRAAGAESFYSYWQPAPWKDEKSNRIELAQMLPYLTNIHIFHWSADLTKLPIADGAAVWSRYLEILDKVPNERYVMIEFVRDDDPQNFISDAEAVKALIQNR